MSLSNHPKFQIWQLEDEIKAQYPALGEGDIVNLEFPPARFYAPPRKNCTTRLYHFLRRLTSFRRRKRGK